MPAPRSVARVRILTTEQIRALSPHGFKAYRTKVRLQQASLHREFREFTQMSEFVSERAVQNIRTLDWLAYEIRREAHRRAAAAHVSMKGTGDKNLDPMTYLAKVE